jgi:hypothetical protein
MRPTLPRLLAGTLVGAAAIFASAPAAFAHGDPSSHTLEQDVLYPAVADRPTPETELRLLGLLYAARDEGYPIKVALVANEQDLTDDASMLQRPQDYAEYVVAQLGMSPARLALVLVITPAGYGLAGAATAGGLAHMVTRPEAARLISSLPPVGAGGEGLAVSALGAVRRLAAESGHPLPAVVAPARPLRSSSTSQASPGSHLDWRLPAGVFVAVMVFAAAAFEVQRRVAGTDVPATDVPLRTPREDTVDPAERSGLTRKA